MYRHVSLRLATMNMLFSSTHCYVGVRLMTSCTKCSNADNICSSSSETTTNDESKAKVMNTVTPAMGHNQEGIFPFTGKVNDIGRGKGEGATLNLPLAEGSGDIVMRTVFDQVIVPAAQRFKPDIILVSAGYDAHVLDPLAEFQFTTGTYYMLASSIKQLATDLCGGRCVFFLEGGYNLESLSNAVAESFRAFIGEPSFTAKLENFGFLRDEPSLKVKEAIKRIKHLHTL